MRVINAQRGPISLQDIYKALESHPLVTAHLREFSFSQPNFHHWTRSAIVRLKKRGLVQHVGYALYNSN